MTLANIKKGKRGKMRERLIILGEKKIGKTTFGAAAPSPIFIPTEDGCSSINGLDYFPKQNTYQGIRDCIISLGKDKHDFETVVFDTLDGIVDILSEEVTTKEFSGSPHKFNNYLQGNKVVTAKLKGFVDMLDRLREEKGMRIILLCHPGTANMKNPEGEDYVKTTGAMGKFTWGLFTNWADRIGYAGYDFIIRNADDAGKKGKAKQLGSERHLRFGGTASLDVGCRVGYELKEDKMMFDYKAYKENQ